MVGIVDKPDTLKKLQILSTDAQYDLACACGSVKEEHRRRSNTGGWIYPITLPNGGRSVLFKTLLSNVCTNDCKYCPLREQSDIRRCTLGSEEAARVFLDYYSRGEVFGLFLSSAVCGSADATMERLNRTARILRGKEGFKGYIHLKVIPGASDAAIEEAVSLATAVSVNIETAGAKHLAKLSSRKDYIRDIIEPIKLISRLTAKGSRFARVKQTTQFIVGAAGESDSEIVKYTAGLYERLRMHRVYFSAYQRGMGDSSLAGETGGGDLLMREHRLYQVDFLFRKYGFKEEDIVFERGGNLSLDKDPKEIWARNHPERFPVNVNRASRFELLKVPGLGPLSVNRILEQRSSTRLSGTEDLPLRGTRLMKAGKYLTF